MRYNPNYDFSNTGVDWEDYEKEARLRTDSIWERGKLRDYFRLFYKIFYWDPKTEKYYSAMPLHSFGPSTDNWRLREHPGYSPTGRTMAFQPSRGWEYPVRTIAINSADTIRDKNTLCYYRFRSYKKCEGNYLYSKIMEMDKDGEAETVNLSCYRK